VTRPAIRATYLIETADDPEAAAHALAGEQSTGTFTRVPLESDALRARAAAHLEAIEPLPPHPTASLPGRRYRDHPGPYRRARIRIAFPLENTGVDLAQIHATVAGNLYELDEVSGVRLERLELPAEVHAAYPSGRFGSAGTRALVGVTDRPLIGTIVKPSIGLTAGEIAALAYDLAIAGLDFMKDDELQGDPHHAPFDERVTRVGEALDRAAQRTGRRTLYAFNLSGDLSAMLRRLDRVAAVGGCAMVNVHAVGLTATHALCRQASVPIHAHRAGFGMMTRHPSLGISAEAMQTLVARTGVDHYHTSGIGNKFYEDDDSVTRSIQHALTLGLMPVLSSGQHPGVIPATYRRIASADVLHLAGGGILAHPDGPAAGTRAMQYAWEATLRGEELTVARLRHPELDRALTRFGILA
jgi:ribulose-bisphosphate carboxylase large chain